MTAVTFALAFGAGLPRGHFECHLSGSGRFGASAGPSEEVLSRIRARKLRILVVDDEETFRRALTLTLRKRYQALVDDFGSAEEALEVINDQYELVLMDVFMPHMSGVEATASIRGRGLAVPIALMSASSENRFVARDVGVRFLIRS